MLRQMFAATPAPTGFRLGERWQTCVAEMNGGKWQKQLTKKERGQLKQMADKLGPRTSDVMAYAIRNWRDFSGSAAERDGVASYPMEPHIGFLLAHCQVAVHRMEEIVKAEVATKQLASNEKAVRDAQESEAAKRRQLLDLRHPDGKPVYNPWLELISYPTDEEYARILEEFDKAMKEFDKTMEKFTKGKFK